MAFLDTFKGKQYKSEVEQLQAEIARLNSLMTPQMQNASNMQLYIGNLQNQIGNLNNLIGQRQQQINTLNQQIAKLNQQITLLNNQIVAKNTEIVKLDEEIQFQDFGVYRPRYDFATSDQYKNRLQQIRDQQKAMIKNGQAVTGFTNWTVNGNHAEGKRMVKDMQKLLLRAFNSECDELIDKVKYNNQECFVTGRRQTGMMTIRTFDGEMIKDGIIYKKLILLETGKHYITERRVSNSSTWLKLSGSLA